MFDFTDLTEEQKAKARACTSSAELIALAEEEGIELTDDQLEVASGGMWGECGSHSCTCNDDCPLDDCHAVKVCPELGK